METSTQNASLAVALLQFAGCCAFDPCHPGAQIAGRVSSTSGAPISAATITIYSHVTTTDAAGCFRTVAADANPFGMVIVAANYRPLHGTPRNGDFLVTVTLAPLVDPSASKIARRATSATKLAASACT